MQIAIWVNQLQIKPTQPQIKPEQLQIATVATPSVQHQRIRQSCTVALSSMKPMTHCKNLCLEACARTRSKENCKKKWEEMQASKELKKLLLICPLHTEATAKCLKFKEEHAKARTAAIHCRDEELYLKA